jgi:hypothetical protein
MSSSKHPAFLDLVQTAWCRHCDSTAGTFERGVQTAKQKLDASQEPRQNGRLKRSSQAGFGWVEISWHWHWHP